MNRFRSRKKSHGGESAEGSRRPSLEADVPPIPSFSSRTFKRKKQAAPEPKPEVDISAALPSSDDFRTSLLMPNLSARFSMLKEQDDPKSKIGKANDDSVLFPKRASRLDLFKQDGLSDIAEVDSLRGSIRPPFASKRTESFGSDGYGTDDGSVMSRARPGEGNTMFGGRQKIYKIPVRGTGSANNLGARENGQRSAGGHMGGKILYESDVATSAFQKLREHEKQEREREGMVSSNLRSSKEHDRPGSPPLAKYNRNRETSSSTNSGPSQSRTSTAATSVASQRSIYGAHENVGSPAHALSSGTQPSSANSDRPFQKARRLYGQGLDQHMHEQKTSEMRRLDSLHRQRTIGGGPMLKNLPQSKSAGNLNDRFQSGGPMYVSNGFRAGSPPPSASPPRMGDFDLGLADENNIKNPTDSGYGRSPPLSPPISPSPDTNDQDSTFVAALEPNDLGKATASGAFNKPKKQYNEQQYLQRQIQLQEGRGTPSPQLIRPFSPPAFSLDEQTTGLSRNNSRGSTLSRSGSVRHPWEHHIEDRLRRAVPERGNLSATRAPGFNQDAMERSFLAGLSDVSSQPESESEADPNSPGPFGSNFQSFTKPITAITSPPKSILKNHLNTNPADDHLREPLNEPSIDSRSYRSDTTTVQPKDHPASGDRQVDADSPTLGPVGVQNGLSGMVRAHLRNQSGQSSIYPEESYENNKLPAEVRQSIFGHESALNHARQESWDSGDAKGDYWTRANRESDNITSALPPPLSFGARHLPDQVTVMHNNQDSPKANQNLVNDKAQRILGDGAPRPNHSPNNSTSWQEQLRSYHARVGSTETQQERESLATELAERRRIVQDNLKSYVDGDSRSSSPGPGGRTHEYSPAKPSPPLGILKKTSKTSLVGKQERPSKAMKMLGITPGSAGSEFSPTQPPPDMFMGRGQLPDRAMPPSQRAPLKSRRPQDVRQHSDNPPTLRTREEPQGHHSHEYIAQRVSKGSSKSGSSYSDKSDRRSGSRIGGSMKTSLERERPKGFNPVTATAGYEPRDLLNAPRPADELMESIARHDLPLDGKSKPALRGHLRNNSKDSKRNHFEPRIAPPGTPHMINPLRPQPNPYSYSAQSSPTLADRRPSLASSASSAPTMLPPPRPANHSSKRTRNSRKRSINKHDISEPMFLSGTSSVDTINLPPGSSLRNGMDSPPTGNPPSIPMRDSRRKRTQTLLQSLGRVERSEPNSTMTSPGIKDDDPYEERSTFSADDEPTSKPLRLRLKKSTSEGGSMAARARQQATQEPSPAVPPMPEMRGPGVNHHLYQAQHDVPASAVMF